MYGDFSRMTYSRAKAYTGVWSQQGRVQLDADANEQTAIFRDWLRTLAVDLIGDFGGHVTRAGFRVEWDKDEDDLTFSPGHYYVGGLRCYVRPGTSYRSRVPRARSLPSEHPFLVQLLVWERSVSAVVDPDLLEPAFGSHPPDTTVRSQVAWLPQVTTRLPDGTPLTEVPRRDRIEHISRRFEEYNESGRRRPLLAAHVTHEVQAEDASIVPATSGYLGVENQLYRVEVHAGGSIEHGHDPDDRESASRPTFKWSRDNGADEFRIVAVDGEKKGESSVTLDSLGRDASKGLEVGDWVELIDDTWAPVGTPGPLLKVHAIDRAGQVVTLTGKLDSTMSLHPYLRRWDQGADGRAGERGIPITESPDDDAVWLNLEDGVQVRFAERRAEYLRGDYWLIPARTATGDVLWPRSPEATALPPAGPCRYLAPLALVHEDGVTDLRTLFTHLAWPEREESGED